MSKHDREKAEAATPGRWVYGENGISYIETEEAIYGPDCNLPTRIAEYLDEGDGKFIAHFNPEKIKKMLDVIERATTASIAMGTLLMMDDKDRPVWLVDLNQALAAYKEGRDE